jgi:predicted transcriptional regulator
MADDDLVEMTTTIVSAYVGGNTVSQGEVADLIRNVHTALKQVQTGETEAPVPVKAAPAVSIKKSITPDFLISLEDGRQFKSLKRYLSTKGMTPDQYRTKWGLPKDYPMVAPNYAASRSALAKAIGLGQGGRAAAKAKPVAKSKPAPAAAPKPRGRPRKTPVT